MAQSRSAGIVLGDDFEIHDEPHIDGSRITVRYIQRQVDQRGVHPGTVADQHGLDRGDVYAALAYYYDNPEELRRVEERRERLVAKAAETTTLTPPDE